MVRFASETRFATHARRLIVQSSFLRLVLRLLDYGRPRNSCRLDLYKMVMSPDVFERLCLRFKASDDAASMRGPVMDSATVEEAGEAPPADVAPQEVVVQDSSFRTEEQICISTGMLSGIVSFKCGDLSAYFISNFPGTFTMCSETN